MNQKKAWLVRGLIVVAGIILAKLGAMSTAAACFYGSIALSAPFLARKFRLTEWFAQFKKDFNDPKKGRVWALGYWGIWAATWTAVIWIPLLLSGLGGVTRAVFGGAEDILAKLIGHILKHLFGHFAMMVLMAGVTQAGVLFFRCYKIFPEGVQIREVVLKKTARSVRGGKGHFFHPLAKLKFYYCGEHTIDDKRTDVTVSDSTGFWWMADMALRLVFQDVTGIAGGPFERDLDSLKVTDPDDLTTFDPTALDQTQIFSRAQVIMQNAAQTAARTIAPDAIQMEASRQTIEEAVAEQVKRDLYLPIGSDSALPDKEQPFLAIVQVKRITPLPATAAVLSKAAEGRLFLDKGLLTQDGVTEMILRGSYGGRVLVNEGKSGQSGSSKGQQSHVKEKRGGK